MWKNDFFSSRWQFETILRFEKRMNIFSIRPIFSLWTQFITLATFHNARKSTTYPFWYQIIILYIVMSKMNSILGQNNRERERETLLRNWFVLVFPAIMILMDWIVYVLLCNLKELCEYSHSLRLKNQHSNQDIFFLDLILNFGTYADLLCLSPIWSLS
jgi:hypothetical protein